MTVSSLFFVHNARSLVGSPYHHQGRVPGHGIDCVGVLICAMQMSGCDMMGWQEHAYGPLPNGVFKSNMEKYFDKVWDRDTAKMPFQTYLKNGDILAMTWKTRPMHCAIVAVGEHGWNMIHAYSAAEKVVEHRIDETWAENVLAVYRVRDVK